ncbi:MAG TPA: DUF4097 family beta strand repeat-containing protein, partial [bacterium]|nr:DUF4097 family beta strand repeat-containing protein [bacterium]
MEIRNWAAGAVALLLAAGTAAAGEPIHEEVPASKNGEVSIENLSGSVTVTVWDEDKVLVEGELGDGSERLEIDPDEGDVSIEVVLPRNARHVEATDLEIRVPRGASVSVETVSADVDVSGVTGDVEVETVSGRVKGRDLAAVEIETVSGEIDVADAEGPVEVASVSGYIEVTDCGDWVEASTTSGDIDVAGDLPDRVECETVSGTVEADITPVKGGAYRFESFSGEVVLRLPAKLDAAIDVETHSGRIRSEWDGRHREERYG